MASRSEDNGRQKRDRAECHEAAARKGPPNLRSELQSARNRSLSKCCILLRFVSFCCLHTCASLIRAPDADVSIGSQSSSGCFESKRLKASANVGAQNVTVAR